MAAKGFAFGVKGSRRFLSGFVAGAVVGAAGAGLTALQFLRSQGAEAALAAREPEGKCGPAFPSSPTQVSGSGSGSCLRLESILFLVHAWLSPSAPPVVLSLCSLPARPTFPTSRLGCLFHLLTSSGDVHTHLPQSI